MGQLKKTAVSLAAWGQPEVFAPLLIQDSVKDCIGVWNRIPLNIAKGRKIER